ncbi:MAG: zf-HC2 domain-containing protein [Acetatifactor sp.]|nr:zf-HC2 domain-containing protein [Acetatifactor sp.]
MMEKITCGIVCDLLPSYLDGLLSESVKRKVEEHLEHCKKCRDVEQAIIDERERERLSEFNRGARFKEKLKSVKHYIIGLIIGFLFPFAVVALWFCILMIF